MIKKFKDKEVKLFYEMLRIRQIEWHIANEYNKFKMRCPVHLSIGQESVPVAVSNNLNKNDQVVTAHRSHAHYLAKGGNLKAMISELHGRVTGCAKGLGGSMHLIDMKAGVTAAVPIVGSTLPIGVGKAWGNKLSKKKDIVVIFFGDGATEEGVFLESLDFAALHDLKILFVCENNLYSVYSRINKRQNKKRSITSISKSIGIESKYYSNHDVLKINKDLESVILNIRNKSKPYLIEVDTYRYLEHCGPNYDDDLNYRPIGEIKKWEQNDQINKLRSKLLKLGKLNTSLINKIEIQIRKEIFSAFQFARSSKYPSKDLLYKYIYF